MSRILKESLDAAAISAIRQQCEDFMSDPDNERWGEPRAIALEAAENIPVLLDVIDDLRSQVATLQGVAAQAISNPAKSA